ncbi:hypothetical protein IT072_19665 [Leifsonia sp. ZF2019]|uniref:hypothetical protein n=1 Tax=Leifsonia sp. ZF2019 TaxID=2781978 RepID=UPI001CC0F959|nr:hypothetical protein [Leifsonia sp. ZF2019]UAJ79376.1 hypothetical protein IT072_19665 [Leifsonia sp. ZF2019]
MNRNVAMRFFSRLLLGVGAGLVALAVPTAAHAADPLLSVESATVTVQSPAPGETWSQTYSTRNVSDSSARVSVTVVDRVGRIWTGPHPVTVSSGDVRVEQQSIDLGSIASGATASVTLDFGQSYEAGNEYARQSGDLTVVFTAVAESPSDSGAGDLARTGGTIATAAIVVAVVLVAGGVVVFAVSRRRSEARRG